MSVEAYPLSLDKQSVHALPTAHLLNSDAMSGTICPLCNKRLSTVTITEISDHGEVTQLPCCHHCVTQLNIQLQPVATPIAEIWARRDAAFQHADKGNADESSPDPASTHTQTLKQAFANTEAPASDEAERRCPDCGLTWEAFLKRNRFGCARDVEIFADLLKAPLRELHGTDEHLGPNDSDEQDLAARQRLARLRAELAQAVAEEAFERAAELRDALKDAENETGEGNQR